MSEPLNWPSLEADVNCDVVIIGAGVSSALIAWQLVAAGLDVIVLETRRIAAGSTSASTALLMYEPDRSLSELIELRGEPAAVQAWQLCRNALHELAALIDQLDLDCGFEPKASLYLASTPADVPALKQELATRQRHGFAVEWLTQKEIAARTAFRRPAALWTPEAAQVDPYRLTHGLFSAAAQRGLRIFEETTVSSYDATAPQPALQTAGGHRVSARRVIFASGYETQHYLDRHIVKLVSSYAMTSAPLPSFSGWPETCLIWETARPYLYLRTTVDGRVIVGGADEEFYDPQRRDVLIEQKCAELKKRFHGLFPDLPLEPEYAWAGTFGETDDSLPYVGALPEYPHALFSLSYGANGILFAQIGAGLLRDAVLGRSNPAAQLFSFDR